MTTEFEDRYTFDSGYGALRQRDLSPQIAYDAHYIESRKHLKTAHRLNFIRFQRIAWYVTGIAHVLDYGCGFGTFSQICESQGVACDNFDLGKNQRPGATVVENPYDRHYDAICLFDVLEHIPDPESTLATLKTDVFMISVPWCHICTLGEEWFMKWKHRRYGEHLWHFDPCTLPKFLPEFEPIYMGHPEDEIRVTDSGMPNILTMIFRRKRA